MADYSNLVNQASQPVPSQKARKFAAGISFNLADEAEAKLRSMFSDRNYEEVLAEIKAAVKAYEEAEPMEALGYEMGGAAAPAVASLLAAPFTGGTSTAAAATQMGPLATKVAMMLGIKNPKTLLGGLGLTGAQGTLSGYGEGEGGFLSPDRLEKAASGGILSTAFGGAVEGLGALSKPVFVGIVDAARRKFGSQVGGRVEAEIQRIAQEMNITPDEAAQQIMDGRILADNKTIAEAVRSYRAGSEAASDMAERRIKLRPQQKQSELIAGVEEYLGGVSSSASGPRLTSGNTNILQTMAKELTSLKDKARALYNTNEAQEAVDPETFAFIKDLYPRAQLAFKEINATRAAEGRPQFKIENNQVVGPEAITIAEAEKIRSALATASNNLMVKQGDKMPTTSMAYNVLEKNLRQRIDNQNDFTRQAREQWSQMSSRGEAFDLGSDLWKASPNPDAIELEMDRLIALGDEEALQAFRLGVLTKLRSQFRNNPTGTSKKILNDQTDMSLAFSHIFPEADRNQITKLMQNQKDAAEAANIILGGSQTGITTAYGQRQGWDFSLADLGMDAVAIGNVAMKLMNKLRPEFTDREKRQIVDILTSSDPARVKRALRDTSGWMTTVKILDEIHGTLKAGSRRAGAQFIATNPQEALNQAIGTVR